MTSRQHRSGRRTDWSISGGSSPRKIRTSMPLPAPASALGWKAVDAMLLSTHLLLDCPYAPMVDPRCTLCLLRVCRWKGKYARIFCICEKALVTLNPTTFEVTNEWAYATDLLDVTTSGIDTSDFAISVRKEKTATSFMTSKSTKISFSCEHRAALVTALLRARAAAMATSTADGALIAVQRPAFLAGIQWPHQRGRWLRGAPAWRWHGSCTCVPLRLACRAARPSLVAERSARSVLTVPATTSSSRCVIRPCSLAFAKTLRALQRLEC